MSEKYKFKDPEGIYFVTSTVVDWLDLFTKPVFQNIVLDALLYAVNKKGLRLHAWVLMSNHLHLIISSNPGRTNQLAYIMRDFKKFTSNQIITVLSQHNEGGEAWMLTYFEQAALQQNETKIIRCGKMVIIRFRSILQNTWSKRSITCTKTL